MSKKCDYEETEHMVPINIGAPIAMVILGTIVVLTFFYGLFTGQWTDPWEFITAMTTRG